jgi:hypothetical protein
MIVTRTGTGSAGHRGRAGTATASPPRSLLDRALDSSGFVTPHVADRAVNPHHDFQFDGTLDRARASPRWCISAPCWKAGAAR